MGALLTRRGLLLSGLTAPALLLSGFDRLGATPSVREIVLTSGERLSDRGHHALGRHVLAREYAPASARP